MDRIEKFNHWKELADYDLDTAEAMFSSDRYLYVAFMCQQAVEKLVKGIYVFHYDIEAPRTHNIWLVLKPLIDEEKLEKGTADYVINKKLFFADLAFYYISERYPSYKENLASRLNKESASDLLMTTKGVFECLTSQYK